VIFEHLRNRRLLATYMAGLCVLFTLVGTFTYINFYLAAPPFNLGTVALGLVFIAYPVSALLNAILGRYIDRLGHRASMMTAFAGGIVGTLLTLHHNIAVIVAGLSLECTGIFLAQSIANSYIGIVAPRGRAAAVGLYVSAYYLGGTLGSAVPGVFWKLGGWIACVALIVFVQMTTIGVAGVFWREEAA
jgi:MFS family permease